LKYETSVFVQQLQTTAIVSVVIYESLRYET